MSRKKFPILVDPEIDPEAISISLSECNQNLRYLFKALANESIPYEERVKIVRSIIDIRYA